MLACGVALIGGVKLLLASRWGLLADEAYYWVWSLQPALGYFDQPPLIAWTLSASQLLLGRSEVALRAAPILLGLLAPLALLRHAGDRGLWLLWWFALPPLVFLSWFATPDAWLLGLWAVGLAGALRGGKGWIVAGLASGLAFLAKYTGALLLPLCLLGADRQERRQPVVAAAVACALVVAAPHGVWSLLHGAPALRFQLHEGLLHPSPPGLAGPLLQLLGQIGVVTPVAALAGYTWALATLPRVRSASRTVRIAWTTSAPLLVFFLIAACGGPPEAHWPAPSWMGIGIGLSHAGRRMLRAAWVGAWLALFASVGLALHTLTPLVSIHNDPAARLTEGRVLGDWVAHWALPERVAIGEPGVADATPVLTERYQEAALIHYYTGIPARAVAGCGRDDQYDLWGPLDPPLEALMVRPRTGGEDLCTDEVWPYRRGPHRLLGFDDQGRHVGDWDLFLIRRGP